MINKNVKDIQRLIKFYDWCFSDEAMDLSMWGPESAGLWEIKDGKKVFRDNALYEAIRDSKKTADGEDGQYYGIAGLSAIFQYSPVPGYNTKAYQYSYPVKLEAYNDVNNFASNVKLCNDGSCLPSSGSLSSALNGYYWSTTLKKQASIIYAKNDTEFEKEWNDTLNDLKTKGQYDAAMQEMLPAFRRINGK
jgi:hypothetical protein